jgi:hypothetical protein
MNMPKLHAIVIATVCILACLQSVGAMTVQLDPMGGNNRGVTAVSFASANDNYPISVEQARNSIRVFMGDLDLEPVLDSTGSLEIGNYYHFTLGDSTFDVNQNSGVVEFAHFGDNYGVKAPDMPGQPLSRDEAYAKATAFAGSKYEGFSGKSWKLVVDKLDESTSWVYNETSHDYDPIVSRSYDFVLREEKDHVLLPSIVHVRVSRAAGAIVDYWGVDRIVTVPSLRNTVSLGNATQIAEDHVYSEFEVSSAEGYLAVVTRSQNAENLAWVIRMTGTYRWNPAYQDTYVVVVDATDGNFLGFSWNSIWPESRLYYL